MNEVFTQKAILVILIIVILTLLAMIVLIVLLVTEKTKNSSSQNSSQGNNSSSMIASSSFLSCVLAGTEGNVFTFLGPEEGLSPGFSGDNGLAVSTQTNLCF